MADRLIDAAELLDKWVITWPYRTDRVLAVLLRVTAAAHHVADVVLGEVARPPDDLPVIVLKQGGAP